MVQCLFFLNLKFQAPSLLPWLHRSACVGPGWKPRLFSFFIFLFIYLFFFFFHAKAQFQCEPHQEENKSWPLQKQKGKNQLYLVSAFCFHFTINGKVPLLYKSDISSFLASSVTVQAGFRLLSALVWKQVFLHRGSHYQKHATIVSMKLSIESNHQ